ncbi:flagellar hook-length control protein FliK [Blastopirellula retiformator]|uniref:Flagellar hook-length control protein FliK n=1 Tax=Blastopirellula retiformator TaxID=2527970 RepID=A0A5C5VLM2_9BACT|nr:flagellar hook-length control protein FliK [Blastopirellula retiformator]TWT39418.1 Flagellar hook-length control protein FliK [Blastopirellula retiformator]
METRDSQGVQSATLSLPPRTIGVAGAAPADALAFITLIQQNSALTPKSPGAEAGSVDSRPIDDQPATEDRQPTSDDDPKAEASPTTNDDAKTVYEADEIPEELLEPAVEEASGDAATDDDRGDEEVIVVETKVATPIEEAPVEAEAEEEAVVESDEVEPAADPSLVRAEGDAADDRATAAELQGEQDEAIDRFDAQLTESVAEENSAAADSETIVETEASGDDQSQARADVETAAPEDEIQLVAEEVALEQGRADEPAAADEAERIREAQEAAAAALEQEPGGDGPSDAEQFASDRREASEKVRESSRARQEADPDAAVDPVAEVEQVQPTPPATSSNTTPDTHTAVAAMESGVAPQPGGTATQPAAATNSATTGDSSSVSEPNLGSAIQRGLQRGLLQKAKGNGDAPKIDSAKQIQLIQRVSQAVRTAQTQGGPIKLRLSPPELGSLRVELEVEEGGMKAKLEAENEAVRKVLLDNLPQLRDRLAELNLRVDSFDVSVGQDGNPQDAGGAQAEQERSSSDQQQSSGQRNSTSGETSSEETTSTPIVSADGQLNVMV